MSPMWCNNLRLFWAGTDSGSALANVDAVRCTLMWGCEQGSIPTPAVRNRGTQTRGVSAMLRKTLLNLLCALAIGSSSAYAGTIDLTTAGASATVNAALGGTAIVQQISPQSTGTGVIDSFLRVHSNADFEQGYNTGPNNQLDNVNGNFTRPLLLSEVPTQTIGGVLYRQFLLDINQTGSDPLISLNQVQIFQAPGDQQTINPQPTGALPIAHFAAPANEIFRLSNIPLTNEILLNFSLNSGSGSGDMFLYVRDSLFANVSNVIFYTEFGAPPGTNNQNDGFEEWAVLKPSGTTCPPEECQVNPAVPEPASLLLLGSGLVFGVRRVRRKKTTE